MCPCIQTECASHGTAARPRLWLKQLELKQARLLIPVRWASERLNNKRTKHVEPKAEDWRTRVQFPPPPPIKKGQLFLVGLFFADRNCFLLSCLYLCSCQPPLKLPLGIVIGPLRLFFSILNSFLRYSGIFTFKGYEPPNSIAPFFCTDKENDTTALSQTQVAVATSDPICEI